MPTSPSASARDRRRSRSPEAEPASKHKRGRDSRRERDDRGDRDFRREKRRRNSEEHAGDRNRDGEGSDEDEGEGDVGPLPPHPRLAELGAAPLSAEDYFQRAAEFKAWLKGKGKFLDEMTGKDARRYFGKFLKRWNEGKLGDAFYTNQIRTVSGPSSSQTRHKWSFASKPSYTEKERETLESIRDSVDTLTNATSRGAVEARETERRMGRGRRMQEGREEGKDVGPEMPPPGRGGGAGGSEANAGARDGGWGSRGGAGAGGGGGVSHPSDLRLEQEEASERRHRERASERKRENRDVRQMQEEMAPRATGRDALVERRRERAAGNRAFADAKLDDGMELDDEVLMGGGGGSDFQKALQASHSRGRGSGRQSDARTSRRMEKEAEMGEKAAAYRAKEQDTMAMFKALAAQRFGGGGGAGAGAAQ